MTEGYRSRSSTRVCRRSKRSKCASTLTRPPARTLPQLVLGLLAREGGQTFSLSVARGGLWCATQSPVGRGAQHARGPVGTSTGPQIRRSGGVRGSQRTAAQSTPVGGAGGVRPAGALERATLFGVRTHSGQPVRTRTTFGPGAVWSLRDHPQAPYGRPSLVGRRPGRKLANPNGGVLLREGHPNGVRLNLFGFASAWSALPQLGAP